MSEVGFAVKRLLATLENGETRAEFGYAIKSRDLRRYLNNMGRQFDNPGESFKTMGEQVQAAFMGHFQNEEGPDPLSGEMKKWPDYNMPLSGEEKESYIYRKEKKYGAKLMLRTGDLFDEIKDPSNIHILGGNNPGLEVSSDLGYGIYGHTGFNHKSGHPTEDQTRRTIFALSPEEEEEIINSTMDDFFNRMEQ